VVVGRRLLFFHAFTLAVEPTRRLTCHER
jgi:hypothetical protein